MQSLTLLQFKMGTHYYKTTKYQINKVTTKLKHRISQSVNADNASTIRQQRLEGVPETNTTQFKNPSLYHTMCFNDDLKLSYSFYGIQLVTFYGKILL